MLNKQNILNALSSADLIPNYLDTTDIANGTYGSNEELYEYIVERIIETDIIYYSKALDFLMEHDPSLRTAMALTVGFDEVTSETLATNLLHELLLGELDDIVISKIEQVEAA